MKFNFKTFSLLCAGVALGLSSCSNDDLLDAGQSVEGDGQYYHVMAGIVTPSVGGTRSATDEGEGDPNGGNSNSDATPDTENPYDFENEIRTLILVYTDYQNNFITHSVVKGITKAPVSGQVYDYVVDGEITHESLEAAYGKDGFLENYDPEDPVKGVIHVFAFCNYTANLETLIQEAAKDPKTTGNQWVDWVGTINEKESPVHSPNPTIDNTIWAPRSFLMTNYKMADVKFPKTIDAWDPYTDRSTPWILNSKGDGGTPDAIQVERCAARFDFKDGSDYAGKDTPNRYDLLLHPNSYGDQANPDEEDSGDYNIVSIQLVRMALVNESKNFFYLRRVADNATATPELLGQEYLKWDRTDPDNPLRLTGNFVVDWDWKAKSATDGMLVGGQAGEPNADAGTEWTNFNFPLYTADGGYNRAGWFVDNISTVLGGRKDQWKTGPEQGDYHIWRYVTENTLPSAKAQVTGQSTGIVFKGKLMAGDDITKARAKDYVSQALVDAFAKVKEDKEKAVNLYSFENRLFAGPEDIIAGAVQDGENSALYAAVNKVLSNWKLDDQSKTFVLNGSGSIPLTVTIYNEFKVKDAEYYEYKVDENFTDAKFYELNQPVNTQIAQFKAESVDGDEWGYYCFYFYWNRHNDNGKEGLMGDMEFATVRNNVYKLAVTGIRRIGHPTIPGDDPDPEEPGKPDEPPTKYIQVQVDVLPWVVRENNIVF